MSDTIIVSLISLVGTLGGTFGGILVSNKLTNYRLEQLESRVNKHNNLIERTYKLEEDIKLHEEKINTTNRRIDDIENHK